MYAFKVYLVAQREIQARAIRVEKAREIHGDYCLCPQCESVNLVKNVTDSMEHIVMEYELVCKDCLAKVAYWAHGSYEGDDSPEVNFNYF